MFSLFVTVLFGCMLFISSWQKKVLRKLQIFIWLRIHILLLIRQKVIYQKTTLGIGFYLNISI